MKMSGKNICCAVCTFFCVLSVLLLPFSLAAGEKRTPVLTVLQTTDIHGSPDILKLRTLIERERRDAGGNVLLIDCGDLVQGTFECSVDQGAEMFKLLDRCSYDVFVPGNHDFEYGVDALLRNFRNFRGTVLCANVFFHPDLKDNTSPWKIFTVNGVRVAVIGCAPEGLERWLHAPFFRKMTVVPVWQGVLRAMREIYKLKEKPQVVILAVHQGEYSSSQPVSGRDVMQLKDIVRRFPAINLVLLGHTHTEISGKPLGNSTWLVQAPKHGSGLARIRIEIDPDSRMVKNISSNLLYTGDLPPTGSMPDAEKKQHFGDQVIARVPSAEMTAQIYAAAMADVTGVKGGFCTRYSLKPWLLSEKKRQQKNGIELTERELYEFIPFENRVTILSLTASELKKILTAQEKFGKKQEGSRLVPYGLPENPDFSGRIDVAFTSFAASGGGSRYPELRKMAMLKSIPRRDLEMTTREIVREYLRKVYPAGLDR